jgi:hypothetical protein
MNTQLGHQNCGCAALSEFHNLGWNLWRGDEGRLSHLAISALGQKPPYGWTPEIWTRIIKMRSRYCWTLRLLAEFILTETLIMEWGELCPTLIILWYLSFRWRISWKYHFLRPSDVLSIVLCQLCCHVSVLKHKSWGICWRSLSTVRPPPPAVLFFAPPSYNQTLLSPLLPVSVISTLHPEGLIKNIQIWQWFVHTARSWSELMYYGTFQFDYIINRLLRLIFK